MLNIQTEFLSDINLNINLNQKTDFTPKSDSIKKYINKEIETVLKESLLDDKDVEHISFKPKNKYIFTCFFNGVKSYSGAGFENRFIVSNTIFKDESFYLFDLYDSYIDINQNLISRNYVKMSKIVKTTDDTTIVFEPKINKEYSNIYIPSYFINASADTFYLKISFFNAVNGKLRFFECSSNEDSSLKNYFKIKINKTNNTYEILNGNIIDSYNSYGSTYQSYSNFKISQIIETQKELIITDGNSLPRIKPTINTKTIITTKGKII
jgi:hypothetical protein